MKKPKLDRFVPQPKTRIQPEAVDFSGAPEIKNYPELTSIRTPTPTSPLPTQTPEPSQPLEPLASKQASNITNNQTIHLANNIAILQKDLEQYILTAYKAQTFRFTPAELRRLKDLSYNLSNLLDKKIGQADLLRLGLLLLEKHLDENRDALLALLQASR